MEVVTESTGADGEDKFIEVPLGTVVRQRDWRSFVRNYRKQVLSRVSKGLETGTLEVLQTKLKICSTWFTRIRDGILELKVLADVGLVGFSKCWKINIIVCSDINKPSC
jgi:GTP-binding protein